MNFFLPESEIELINTRLCALFKAKPGFTKAGEERLIKNLPKVIDTDVSSVATEFYIAIIKARPFISFNEATAFGALHAFLGLCGLKIPAAKTPPLSALFPKSWGDAERMELRNWIKNSIEP